MSGLNRDDFVRGDFLSNLVNAGFKPPGGGGGGTPLWFTLADANNLVGAYDVRGVAGGSTITEDADPAVSTLSDLSGQSNNCTHWRGTGTNVEKASMAGTDPDSYIDCQGNENANEEHWGFQDGQIEELLTEWHWFTVMKCNPDTVKTQASTSSTGAAYRTPSSSGTNGRPYLGFDSVGGSASTAAWNTVVNGGGGQFNSGSAGSVDCNLESLAGRAETDAANRYALVEWRHDFPGSLAQVWVNGFKIGETSSPLSPDTMNYVLFGKLDLNIASFGMHLQAVALGVPGKSGRDFTTTNAAAIRAAILADFGIETWDGATYPS